MVLWVNFRVFIKIWIVNFLVGVIIRVCGFWISEKLLLLILFFIILVRIGSKKVV